MINVIDEHIPHDPDNTESRVTLFKYSMNSIFAIAIFTFFANTLWQYNYEQQLSDLEQSAIGNLALYGNKVEHELDQFQQSLLSLLANQPRLQQFLLKPDAENSIQTQEYLEKLKTVFSNSTVFLGHKNDFLFSKEGAEINSDSVILNSAIKSISSRAFQNKKTSRFVFDKEKRLAKYLLAQPVYESNKKKQESTNKEPLVIGYIGLLIDLSALQNELSNSLLNNQQIVLMSDQRGIIMLSSNQDWQYQTFTNLPYLVKKQIDVNFNEKNLFTQLSVTNIDNNILTTIPSKTSTGEQKFLVHSMLLDNHSLRIHHLANITSVIERSNFIVAFFSVFLLMFLLLLLFFKEKRKAYYAKKEHENELFSLESEFKQQQKLASIGMVATNIAHEINQPITAIKTEAKVGNKWLSKNNTQEVSESFQAILKYTDFLSAITIQLKDFSRKRNTNGYNEANINKALTQSLALNKNRLIENYVDLLIDEYDKNLCVRIEPHQLQQIFNNLLQNTCDAMSSSQFRKIYIQIKTDGPMVNILFCDNGPGIPLSLQDNIFDPFVSSKGNASSMGLGLAICHDIISRVGGGIELIVDQPIKDNGDPQYIYTGACFKISLVRIVDKA